jgi:hypothetical protein
MDEQISNTPKSETVFNKVRVIFSKYTAIFVSLLSLFAVIYQSYLGREENKLIRIQQSATVRPYLGWWFTQNNGQFQIIIGNKGIGPAFIEDVSFKVIDNKTKDTLNFDNSDSVIHSITNNSTFLDTLKTVTSTFRKNTVIPAQEEISIVSITYPQDSLGKKVRSLFMNPLVDYKITYKDVYDTKWFITSSNNSPVKIQD